MRVECALLSIGTALVSVACGGGGGGGGGGGAGSGGTGASGGSGGGGGGEAPAACASRAPVDDGFAPVTTEVATADTTQGIYTDFFAGDLAIAEDVLVVGLPSFTSQDTDVHASTLVYRFDGSTWRYEDELLPAPPADATTKYGDPVEISHSGNTVIVGNDSSAFIFRWSGDAWIGGEELAARNDGDLLASVSVTDERAAVGYYKNGDLPGSVYVYRSNGNGWELEQRIVDTRFDSSSGTAVALDGDWLVVSSRQQAAYAYHFENGEWVEAQELRGSYDGSLHGERLLLRSSGSLIVYELDTDAWVECESFGCNRQCDASIHGGRLIHGGAPAYSGDSFGRLMRFDGAEWVEDLRTEFEPRAADMGRAFGAFAVDGGGATPVVVVQVEPFE